MANRKTRRKQEKIYSKGNTDEDQSLSNSIKMVLIVIIIFVIFYIITVYLTNNISKSKNATNNDTSNTTATIQYEEILAGEVFNMNSSDYYVIFYDFDDSSANLYKSIVSNYKTNHTTGKIYTVDLSNGFNKSYVSDTSNISAQNGNDLKVKGPTLIEIKNGVNAFSTESTSTIAEILK